MGENLDVEGRSAVRTPMQWSADPGGGFSTADPAAFPAPPPDGGYGPGAVNVAAQRRDPSSLLNWFERLIRRRRETPELGFGQWRVVPNDERSVLCHRSDWDGATVVAVHNFAAEPSTVDLDLADLDGAVALDDLFDGAGQPLEGGRARVELEGYGYRWLRVRREGDRPRP